jgi:hypothetical protein
MPGPQLFAKASSMPVLPPGLPCIEWKARVEKNHSLSLGAGMPERSFEALALAGPEAVERNREVVNPNR